MALKTFFICIPHKFKVLVDLVPLALMMVFMKKNAVTVTHKLLTNSTISVTPIFRLSAVPNMGLAIHL